MDDKISIFILNHGKFGEELVESAKLIVGEIEDIYVFSLLQTMSLEDFYITVKSKYDDINNRILILCDLFGGTPCNVAMMLSVDSKSEIVCGVNLPILIDVVLSRSMDKDLEEIVNSVIESGKNSINTPYKIKKG